MRRIIISLIIILAITATSLYAHGPGGEGHGPKTLITESQAIERATQLVASIVEQGKLDESWAKIQPDEAQKKTLKNGSEWVIIFNNPHEKDLEKQKLYVFLSLYGQYLGANHTGS